MLVAQSAYSSGVDVVITKCGECGAPLRATGYEKAVECSYCGEVNRLKGPSPNRPSPAPSAFPVVSASRLEEHAVAHAKNQLVVKLISLGAAALAGVAILTFVVIGIFSRPASVPTTRPRHERRWTGNGPFVCSGQERFTFEGVESQHRVTTGLRVEGHCEVTLIGARLFDAFEAIRVGGDGRVIIRGSTISAQSVGVVARERARVELHDTDVQASGPAVWALEHASVTVVGGSLIGSPTALSSEDNARIDVAATTEVIDGRPL